MIFSVTMFCHRWKEFHWLHADSYRGRFSQDTCCVWAGCGRQGPLRRVPSQRQNAQCSGGLAQTGLVWLHIDEFS